MHADIHSIATYQDQDSILATHGYANLNGHVCLHMGVTNRFDETYMGAGNLNMSIPF